MDRWNGFGETPPCIEPARNPLARLSGNRQDTDCVRAARNPLGDRPAAGSDSASLGRVLWALINR